MSGERRFQSTRVHGNKLGYRGIEWHEGRGRFRAVIWPLPTMRRHLGWYLTAEEAAVAYDRAARAVYGGEAYLNFPRAGEHRAVGSRLREGICPNDHNLAEHGYIRPDGRGTGCRRCNRLAARRYYWRKKFGLAQNGDEVKG